MAVERQDRSFSLPLGDFVSRQQTVFQSSRTRARDFIVRDFSQRVIDEGLSYQDQKDFYNSLISKEKDRVFVDEDYIKDLKKNVTDLNKLIRAEKFTNEFNEKFDNLVSGQLSIGDHVSFLETELSGAIDADLKATIQTKLSEAKQAQYTSQKSIFDNQVTYALNDKTEDVLQGMITKAQKKKNEALLGGDNDWASAIDVQLLSLNKQLAQSRLQKQVSENIARSLADPNPVNTLAQLNQRLSEADTAVPVTVNGTTYDSARDFWDAEKSNYLGSGQFFNELNQFWTNHINATQARSQASLVPELRTIKSNLETMLSNPDLVQYGQLSADTVDLIMRHGADLAGNNIVAQAKSDFNFSKAAKQLEELNSFSGIDMTTKYQDIIASVSQVNFQQAQTILDNASQYAQAAGRSAPTMEDLNLAIQATPNLIVSPTDLAERNPADIAKGVFNDTIGKPAEDLNTSGTEVGGSTGQRRVVDGTFVKIPGSSTVYKAENGKLLELYGNFSEQDFKNLTGGKGFEVVQEIPTLEGQDVVREGILSPGEQARRAEIQRQEEEKKRQEEQARLQAQYAAEQQNNNNSNNTSSGSSSSGSSSSGQTTNNVVPQTQLGQKVAAPELLSLLSEDQIVRQGSSVYLKQGVTAPYRKLGGPSELAGFKESDLIRTSGGDIYVRS